MESFRPPSHSGVESVALACLVLARRPWRQLAELSLSHHLQQAINNQTFRNQAIEQIYGAAFADHPRVKAEAVRTLVAIELARVSDPVAANSVLEQYLNLHDANLTDAWLENADLRKVSFRKANLTRANVNRGQLTEAPLRFATLVEADLLFADASGAQFAFADLTDAQLSNANLTNATFANSRLQHADLVGADVAGASLVNCDLRFATLGDIKNWEKLASVDGTNIGKVSAPLGFVAWALARGAVDQPDAPDTFLTRRTTMLAEEETTNRE